MLLNPIDFVGISLQPGFHVIRNILGIERSLVAVSKDLGSAVVATDNDEALLLADVEYVIVVVVGCLKL